MQFLPPFPELSSASSAPPHFVFFFFNFPHQCISTGCVSFLSLLWLLHYNFVFSFKAPSLMCRMQMTSLLLRLRHMYIVNSWLRRHCSRYLEGQSLLTWRVMKWLKECFHTEILTRSLYEVTEENAYKGHRAHLPVHLYAWLVLVTTLCTSIKFVIVGLHWKFPGEFTFGSNLI
jgi:hypothetical protein